jgi:cephalosporin-C deacetylase
MFSHPHPFDPTYGYTLEDLLKVPAPDGPADFEAFWRQTYEEAMQIPLNITQRRITSPSAEHDLYEIEYDSLQGVRIGGWLVVPSDGKFERAVVCGHGYGGRESADFNLPTPRAIGIFPCKRGFHRSAHAEIPNAGHQHVMHGIESRETYSHRGSVVDLWCGASALIALYPQAAENLHYQGGSFGGGIGALALPWDKRISKAYLDVPSFGNHPLRVTLPCVGSGQSVQEYYHAGHPEILEVLQYFDAATAAKHIRIPTLVAAALFDPAVPPPGQFAVYNALAGKKELFVRQAAHFAFRGEAEENARLHKILCAWFKD